MIKNNLFKVCIITILVAFFITIFYFNNKTIMFSSNMEKSISEFWGQEVRIKEVEDFQAYGKKFKMVLSTPVDNEKYKYLNCYEDKLNGLYYKIYQSLEQGRSNALFSFISIFLDNEEGSNKENCFTVVYGYNKDSKVDNYEIKISGEEGSLISNVSNKEYFIDVINGKFHSIISATDKEGNDKIDVFCD